MLGVLYTPRQKGGLGEDRSGKYIILNKKDKPETVIYPWFGIYYDQEETFICIIFSKRWCSEAFNGVKQNSKEGKFYTIRKEKDGSIWFELKLNYFKDFNSEELVEKQEELLTEFFNEVIREVKQYL